MVRESAASFASSATVQACFGRSCMRGLRPPADCPRDHGRDPATRCSCCGAQRFNDQKFSRRASTTSRAAVARLDSSRIICTRRPGAVRREHAGAVGTTQTSRDVSDEPKLQWPASIRTSIGRSGLPILNSPLPQCYGRWRLHAWWRRVKAGQGNAGARGIRAKSPDNRSDGLKPVDCDRSTSLKDHAIEGLAGIRSDFMRQGLAPRTSLENPVWGFSSVTTSARGSTMCVLLLMKSVLSDCSKFGLTRLSWVYRKPYEGVPMKTILNHRLLVRLRPRDCSLFSGPRLGRYRHDAHAARRPAAAVRSSTCARARRDRCGKHSPCRGGAGPIDALVNNAGFGAASPVEPYPHGDAA